MIFGVLKDIKEGENRVICTPIEVASIVADDLLPALFSFLTK